MTKPRKTEMSQKNKTPGRDPTCFSFLPIFFLQEQGRSRLKPTPPPSTSLHSFCLHIPSHLTIGSLPLPCTNPMLRRGIPGATRQACCWGAVGWQGRRGENRWRESAEGGGAELSLPISRRIVPDTRRPRGVSVSGSFAGAVTHARRVRLRAGSGQE